MDGWFGTGFSLSVPSYGWPNIQQKLSQCKQVECYSTYNRASLLLIVGLLYFRQRIFKVDIEICNTVRVWWLGFPSLHTCASMAPYYTYTVQPVKHATYNVIFQAYIKYIFHTNWLFAVECTKNTKTCWCPYLSTKHKFNRKGSRFT